MANKKLKCINCNNELKLSSSKTYSHTLKEIYYVCDNCDKKYKAYLEIKEEIIHKTIPINSK